MWDERYRGDDYAFGTDPNEFVVAATGDWPPGRALDLGSGEGRNAVWLAARGWDVTAVDVSPRGMQKANDLAAIAGVDVELVTADLTAYEPEAGTYDLVLLSYVQVPPGVRTAIHAAAIVALAPGGRVVVVAHHLDNLANGIGGPRTADVLYTCDTMSHDFGALEIERCERVIRTVGEGSRHGPGEAIDLLCVARKP
jgi:SAM-dependent methyltransferase